MRSKQNFGGKSFLDGYNNFKKIGIGLSAMIVVKKHESIV